MLQNGLRFLPGGLLALGIAWVSLCGAELDFFHHYGFSALTIAIILGVLLGNSVYPRISRVCLPGVVFAKHYLLRLGIILFGFRITFQDMGAVGFSGVLVGVMVLASTFFLAFWFGRKYLKLDDESAILIGAGSAICGAAAVLATESVLKADPGKVAVAVATVVIFGTLAMFLYPLVFQWLGVLGVSEFSYGVFAGSTVHEVAQALVAGDAVGEVAAKTAVITKMIRVMLLAPFLLLLSVWLQGRSGQHQPASGRWGVGAMIPWFVLGFMLVVGVNSLIVLPATWKTVLLEVDNLMLAAAMGALGITTHFSAIRTAGIRPLVLAALLFAWLLLGGGMINMGVSFLVGYQTPPGGA